jgi:hypothetical protein
MKLKNFRDLEMLGLHEPTVNRVLDLIDGQDITREDALCSLVFFLVQQKQEIMAICISVLANSVTPHNGEELVQLERLSRDQREDIARMITNALREHASGSGDIITL